MRTRSRWIPILLLAACATPPSDPFDVVWTACTVPGVTASLRGLSVVSADVVWASGADATVLSSTDGGATWEIAKVAEAARADLRSIHAFDARTAVVATAGAPARILRTTDGGATWEVTHEERDPRAFLDSVRFIDRRRGYAFGDPLGDGAHYVLTTEDGGARWRRLARTPPATAGEAGFAASGSCIDADGALVRIGTGGSRARVLLGRDDGGSWSAAETPLLQGQPSQGVFSVAFADARRGVVVGGDYLDPDRRDGTAAFSVDGGLTWTAAPVPPGGFRSAAAFAPAAGPGVVVAVGTNGADISADGGRTWRPLGGGAGRAHHAIAFAPRAAVGFAAGADGRVTRIQVVRTGR